MARPDDADEADVELVAIPLTATLRAELVDAARSALPNEACGLVFGRPSRERAFAFDFRLVVTTNVLARSTAFSIDPTELVDRILEAEDGGESLVAIMHSHPTTRAWPSVTDVELAGGEPMLIVSLAEDEPEISTYRAR